jgi:hypothetical protein
MGIELQIENSDGVISLFGYWPKFCDARLEYFSFSASKKGRACIIIELLYLDVDKSIGAEIRIVFSGVYKTDINHFFDENILDEMIIVRNVSESNYSIELQSCYGISGRFSCERIEVKEIQPA